MAAENHNLVGLLAAANLGDDIALLDRSAGFIRQRKLHADLLVGFQQA